MGSSADNAAAESFNATFKRKTLKGRLHGGQQVRGWPAVRPIADNGAVVDTQRHRVAVEDVEHTA
ncbi:hypothetical protein [Streptomyces sp. NPDC102437]|uniref:hypothetical protein n=1 Tax=Streptomyces sp. NPDC102437 TaxID=3366175 RepID=UPI0038011D16